jgi:O-antigen/teichoic acid export membrane protein
VSTYKQDLVLLSIGRATTAFVALLTVRVVTTFLSPEQFGELTLLITTQTLISLFLINPLIMHISIHTIPWWREGVLLGKLKSFQKYVLAASIFGGLSMIFKYQQQTTMESCWAIASMFFMVIASAWNVTIIPILNMLGYRKASVSWSVLSSIASLILAICLVWWLQSPIAWFMGQALGLSLGAIGAKKSLNNYGLNVKHSQSNQALLSLHTAVTYCFPLAIAAGLMWAQLSGYRFLIENYWGLIQLGFFAVGLQLAGQIFSLVESLTGQFLSPLFYKRVSMHETSTDIESAFSDLLNSLFPLYFVLTGVVIWGSQYFLNLLVAKQFQDSAIFVILGASVELCRVLGNLLSNAAHVRRKTFSLMIPYACGAGTTLLLIYLVGIRDLTIIWAAISLQVGAGVMLIFMFLGMHAQIKFKIDTLRVFIGMLLMFGMIFLRFSSPNATDLYVTLEMIFLILIVAVIAIFSLSWRNPAIIRLLRTNLRNI